MYLVEQRNRLVTKDELLEHIWPDLYVADIAVARAVAGARRAIGDSRGEQGMIRTVHGQGYRFVATVIEQDAATHEVETRGGTPARFEDRTGIHPIAVVSAATATQPTPEMVVSPERVSAGERKLITVLCCLLPAPASQVIPLDLDDQHELLLTVHAEVQRSVQPYEGSIQHLGLDRIEMLFGAPVAQEDHAQRAILGALALQTSWPQLAAAFGSNPETGGIRVGLHTGMVVIGGIAGAASTRPMTVVGDVPTLAIALAKQASRGTIVVSEATAQLIQDVVHLEDVPAISIATQPTPITAYRAHVQAAEPTSEFRQRVPRRSHFVNRQAEMVALSAGLDRAVDGQGQVIGMVGEPGIGKSRLLEAFRQQVAELSITYLSGACQSYGLATPYLPLLALIRQRCGLHSTDDAIACRSKIHDTFLKLDGEPDEWAPLLLHLLGVSDVAPWIYELRPHVYRARVFTAMHHLFLGMSKYQPLVIELEDLHWVDPTTEAYLAAFAERLTGTQVLLLVTYRPGYQPPWLSTSTAMQIALLPLVARDSQQLVCSLDTTRHLSEVDCRQIVTYANGNPLFLEELTKVVDGQEDGGPMPVVPDTVQMVLAAWIDRLPAESKQLLQVAAVVGNDVPLALLRALVPFPDDVLSDCLHHLQVEEFLYETHLPSDITYTFKHESCSPKHESCSPIVVTVGCPPQTTIEGGLPMGLLIRDDRQMKALTGVSQAQFDFLLPAFSYVYQEPQQQRYEEGGKTDHRSRKPGAGIKGKLPTMADKLLFVLYYYQTYPTFDVLGTQFDMVRSKANENLHKRSPILYDTLVEFDLRPYRELETPEALRAALTGVDQLLIDATARTCRRSQDDAAQREYYSGKKKTIR